MPTATRRTATRRFALTIAAPSGTALISTMPIRLEPALRGGGA